MLQKRIASLLLAIILPVALYAADAGVGKDLPVPPAHPLSSFEQWMVYMPILLFVLIAVAIFLKLWVDKVSLRDLLTDKDLLLSVKREESKKTESQSKAIVASAKAAAAQAAAAQAANVAPPAANIVQPQVAGNMNDDEADDGVEKTSPNQQSISRLLAFISGLVSVGLACCVTTFYMWSVCTGNTQFDIAKLSNVLLTLGIGVIPYGFNKFSGAFKS